MATVNRTLPDISPVKKVIADLPTCASTPPPCTWIPVGGGHGFRLKYVNRACQEHKHLLRYPAYMTK